MHFKYIYLHKLFATTNNPHAWLYLSYLLYYAKKENRVFLQHRHFFKCIYAIPYLGP